MSKPAIDSRQVHKQLKLLEAQVNMFLANMGVIMLRKEGVERGKMIAEQCNALSMANQIAARFGLGIQRVGGKPRKVAR